jgi:hypothetical protein
MSTMAVVQAARRTLTGLAPFATVVLVSLVVLFAPQSATPSTTLPPGTDKVIHMALFAALAWTGRRAGLPVVGLAIGLVTYAVGSEVLQGALPIGRSPDAVDAVVDTVGIAVGLIAARWSVAQPRGRRHLRATKAPEQLAPRASSQRNGHAGPMPDLSGAGASMHHDGATDDEPTLTTVRDRLTAAGLSDERIDQHMTAGRVRVDGELITDLDTPAPAGTRLVIWTE